MLRNLDGLYFRQKIYQIKKYIKRYYNYSINRIKNQFPLGSLQSIQILLQFIYMICLDFIIAFSIVPSKDILQAIEGFDTFNNLFTTICKSSKRKLLISGNKRYSIEDQSYIFSRQLLLNDWSYLKIIILNKDFKFISSFQKSF